METLLVELGERSYPIRIGPRLLGRADLIEPHIQGQQVMVVTNETVAPLYLQSVSSSLASKTVRHCILPDGEQYKTLDTVNRVFDALLEAGFGRSATLVALGGGVVGDMAGFAAACYQRGIRFIQVPTTLLSQVDSSVGGKTGVNHPLGKNMIGAFYQPELVLIDTDSLQTLPKREFSAGIAEVIKYGMVFNEAFFCWLEDRMEDLLGGDNEAIAYAIRTSCECKAEVVRLDEREGGVRALLNFGHTFGHAIEAHQGYGAWLHGEAVAAGMVMAADLSARLGWINKSGVKRLVRLLERAGLPVAPPTNMGIGDFRSRMLLDKKTLDGQLRLILLRGLGQGIITDNVNPILLDQTLGAGSTLGQS